MSETRHVGANLSEDVVGMIESTAKESGVTKTEALKELVIAGRKTILLDRYLQKYANGECDIGTIAKKTGLPYTKVMDELSKAGIPLNNMTLEELKEEIALL
ncbi:MAG TPA: hypothetical protein VJG90_02310 [Candidatus Nanoarchaeia archaeon]|nr:hypothetical protein [Candidatus Nanoarchaeia archaeon]